MTIRRSVDISSMNRDYSAFHTALDYCPVEEFMLSHHIGNFVVSTMDDLESNSRFYGVAIDNCDMIREVEALIFDMVRRKNKLVEVEKLIRLGHMLDDVPGNPNKTASRFFENEDDTQ